MVSLSSFIRMLLLIVYTEHETNDPAADTGAGYDHLNATEEEHNESQSNTIREHGAQGKGTSAEQQEAGGTSDQQAPQRGVGGKANDQEERPQSTAMKKIGDTLEKWYKQNRRIRESSQADSKERLSDTDIDMADADFEHIPNENAEADTQAVGTATEEEARTIDESMALPAIERDEQQQDEKHAMDLDEANEDEERKELPEDYSSQTQIGEHQEHDIRQSTFIGERTGDAGGFEKQMELDNESDTAGETSLEVVEEQLSNANLEEPLGARSDSEARDLWARHESNTRTLAQSLTEQLRLILEPTSATKLRGDFRTGKRLNLKRIIPYIASSYKRDKIWLRRSLPSKRAYQIMIALDDSQSMSENGSSDLAFETVALVSRALTMLEAGELCIAGFGSEVQIAHPFDRPFSSESGVDVFKQFNFRQTRTDVRKLVEKSIDIFQDARLRASGTGSELWQLQIIISDGICDNHADIQRLVRQAQEMRIMVVFVIVDAVARQNSPANEHATTTNMSQHGHPKQSILDLQSVDITEKGEVVRWKYMDRFPFRWYLVVRNVRDLPGVLAMALRQWFAEIAETA
jgi:midasin